MNQRLKIKILKYNKKLFHVVVMLKKKSIYSSYFEKLGVSFFRGNKKFIILSLKNISYWLNKGALFNKFISFLMAIFFIMNKKKYINRFFVNNVKKENKLNVINYYKNKK